MAILAVLILLVPAVIGVLCYERFKGYLLIWRKRVELFLIFAFLINMSVYGVMWLRGWGGLDWSFNSESTMVMTSVVFQYMVMALVASVALAYVLSLVRVGISRSAAPPEQEEEPESKD